MPFEAGIRYYLMSDGTLPETNLAGKVVSIFASIVDFAWSLSLILAAILIVLILFLELFGVFAAVTIYFISGSPTPGGKFDAYLNFTSVLIAKTRKVLLYAAAFGVSAFLLGGPWSTN